MFQAAIGHWAQAEFKLKNTPSAATISKILKAKREIMVVHNDVLNSKRLLRKRNQSSLHEAQETLEQKLLGWIQHHNIVHGGRVALSDNALVLQARSIALEEGLELDPQQFNFSTKWLERFKVINNITRIKLHGEGADADMDSVSITREQLPRILGK